MYTPFWLDILDIEEPAVIFEPINHHGLGLGWNTSLQNWEASNPYARPGFQENLGFIGYVPFATANGMSRNLPLTEVPNPGNWKEFVIKEEDAKWYAANFFPQDTMNRSENAALSVDEIRRRVRMQLNEVYGEIL